MITIKQAAKMERLSLEEIRDKIGNTWDIGPWRFVIRDNMLAMISHGPVVCGYGSERTEQEEPLPENANLWDARKIAVRWAHERVSTLTQDINEFAIETAAMYDAWITAIHDK